MSRSASPTDTSLSRPQLSSILPVALIGIVVTSILIESWQLIHKMTGGAALMPALRVLV